MPAAAQALAALADDIWHAAGDTSADYNWCAGHCFGDLEQKRLFSAAGLKPLLGTEAM